MSAATSPDTDVLIVGAGPTGLVLALWLVRLGVRVRIIDKATEPGTTSRALAVQARTLELYRSMGIADAVVAAGHRLGAVNLWASGRKVAHVELGDIGGGISPYAFAVIYPQDEHERFLIARLEERGVAVERGTELLDFDERDGVVRAQLALPGGGRGECAAAFVAGCDGARSRVREKLAVGFPGGTYSHLFYVADVEGRGPAVNGELHVALDNADFLGLFPLADSGRARLIGSIRAEAERPGEHLGWDDVGKQAIERMRVDVSRVNWFSTYHVHHRVAGRFRSGRAFLLGDAAHIHSPVGGQGMNTGIGDAVNLAWKLAAVVRGSAPAAILDTYEPERIAFARRLVATTDRAFTAVTSDGPLARFIRLRAIPAVLPLGFRFRAMRRLLFRIISQTAIRYRESALSTGRAGSVHGGDRLPWVESADNFAPLSSLAWQVHVYGMAASDLAATCERRGVPLHAFEWTPDARRAGLRQGATYLVRPDGYVALADPEGRGDALEAYLDGRGIDAHV